MLQTIEYICNKQGKPPSILQDTLGLLLSSGQEDENLYLVSCWIRHSFSFCGAIQMESQGSHPLDVMMETAGHREEILDPVLLLSLIFQQVSQDYCYLPQSSTQNAGDVSTTSTDHISMLIDKIHLYHNKHLMTFCIACLMVDHERIQWITRACLEYFFEMLSAPNVTKYYPQAQSMSVFINILKHSIITEVRQQGGYVSHRNHENLCCSLLVSSRWLFYTVLFAPMGNILSTDACFIYANGESLFGSWHLDGCKILSSC